MNETKDNTTQPTVPAKQTSSHIGRNLTLGCAGLLLIAAFIAFLIQRGITSSEVHSDIDKSIGITPTQIAAIKGIGQWEFLSISDEEMIDTVRNGFFSDDELIRIYYGTLRLGIDMRKLPKNWITREQGIITVLLPPIQLLDEDFIDEARTLSFYESGSWSHHAREDMYQRAKLKMKQRCMNSSNIKSAEQNASKQFYQLLRSLGFENVVIRFADNEQTIQQPSIQKKKE